MLQGRRRCRSTFLSAETNEIHVLLHNLAGHMFCQEVRGVLRSRNLGQSKIALSKAILYPKIGYGKVSNFAQPATSADAYSRRRIREDLKVQTDAEIAGQ